jgi:heme exporter protein C
MMRWLGWLSLLTLLASGVWIFAFAPDDALMGFSQKIMYLHVPSVLACYLAVFIVLLTSIAYLWKRAPGADRLARSAAEVGALFAAMVLVTGSLWGRPTWGTYWIWDARLTSMLLLFLILTGYVLLREFAGPGEQAARLAAIIGIVGALDVPLIHLSVQWWRTLHQPTTLFKVGAEGAPKPAMPLEMLLPLLLSAGAMVLFFLFLLWYRLRVAELTDDLHERLAGR